MPEKSPHQIEHEQLALQRAVSSLFDAIENLKHPAIWSAVLTVEVDENEGLRKPKFEVK